MISRNFMELIGETKALIISIKETENIWTEHDFELFLTYHILKKNIPIRRETLIKGFTPFREPRNGTIKMRSFAVAKVDRLTSRAISAAKLNVP